MRLQDKYLMSHVKTMWRCQNITTLCPGLQRDQHLTVNTTHNCFHYRSITQGNSAPQLYGIIWIAFEKRKGHIFNIALPILSSHELSNVNRSQVWYITKINCVSWYIVTMTISPHYIIDIWTGHKEYKHIAGHLLSAPPCYYSVCWKIASMYF